MSLCRFASVLFVLGLSLCSFGQNPPSVPDLGLGIVVEKIEKKSESEKSGLKEGDILLSWTRGDHAGKFGSPFDFSFVDLEERPRGKMTIAGLRGSEQMVWTLTPECVCVSGVVTRPNFSARALSLYRQAGKRLLAGRISHARRAWRRLASRSPNKHWLYPWLLKNASNVLLNLRRWNHIDQLLQESVEAALAVGSTAASLTERCWGSSLQARGKSTAAARHYRRALEIDLHAAPESLAVAADLQCLSYVQREHQALAKDYLLQAIALEEKLAPSSFEFANSLLCLGYYSAEEGDFAGAEQNFKKAAAIQREISADNQDLALSLVYLGGILSRRGELSHAESYFRRAVALERDSYSRPLALALDGIAMVVLRRWQPLKAEYYERQALAIQRKANCSRIDVAMFLNNLSIAAMDRGDLSGAEKYAREALKIQAKLVPESLDFANTLSSLGDIYTAQHKFRKARQFYDRALAMDGRIAPHGEYVADALQGLGALYWKAGKLKKSEENYRKSLAIWQKIVPGSAYEADTRAAVGKILHREHDYAGAASLYEESLGSLENLTNRLGGTEDVHSGFRAKHEDIYRNYIDLLIAQNQPERAFEVLERSRARSLLEALSSTRIDLRKGTDPVLLQQEQSLQQSLTAKSNQRLRLLNGNHTLEELKAIDREIADLLGQYQEVEGQLRASSPAYVALTQPQPLSAKQVQQQLLDPDTLLLEYSLGEQRSYLFTLSADSLNTYALPGRKQIEGAARQVYHMLKVRAYPMTQPAHRRQANLAYAQAVARLSRMILAPAASELNRKRLLVVTDGALAYVPFAALPQPQVSSTQPQVSSAQSARLLSDDHEIVDLPSASAMAVLGQQLKGRQPAPKSVAVLADPVFSQYDSRVRAARSSNSQILAAKESSFPSADSFERDLPRHLLVRSAADVGLSRSGALHLTRLPFTRLEAEAIATITAPEQHLEALDFHASRSTATSPDLGQYRIIHFATHGLLDSQHPELSGLVLSLVDEQGQPQNGFVGLEDIYNMTLNADLVVLSACETGLGKQIDGEGLVGLTRGFMYAGASRVLASLWRVDDEATAELMKKFYQAMLKDGQRPAQALGTAQRWMRQQKAWAAPYYWAGFVLQGEWR